ncbi:MAG: diadenylate cyclase CdaA [Spirochaetes bacterium]|nr:diadenylate cyclase CdaA [Spirochaetota bacterium]
MVYIYLLKNFFFNYFIPFVDIVILTFTLFYIYLFIEKTKASNLAKGLFIVLLLFILMKLLNFPIVSWFFENILSNLLIFLIILFSPEIRSLLINLGKRQIFRKLPKEQKENINIIVNSLKKLSEKNIGALIVIQRKNDLKQIISNYIPLDASISEDMFYFIFDRRSILHDGACIVKDNRIICAAAILPLTEKTMPEQKLGTRHRAAVGITEESDAIALVVSEQTGAISLCEGGQIFFNIDEYELRKKLIDFLYLNEDYGFGEIFEIKDAVSENSFSKDDFYDKNNNKNKL